MHEGYYTTKKRLFQALKTKINLKMKKHRPPIAAQVEFFTKRPTEGASKLKNSTNLIKF
jgi:hypothetical protein